MTKAGSFYIRAAMAFVANESSEPVTDVWVSIGVGYETRSIGPLAVPPLIPVLPARRTLMFDITRPLRAHRDTKLPRARILFTDSNERQWERNFDGKLRDVTEQNSSLIASFDSKEALEQMGDLGDPGNPMTVVGALHSILFDDDEVNVELLRQLLAPEAPYWESLDDDELVRDLQGALKDRGIAAHVYWPTPQVAFARFPAMPVGTSQVKGAKPMPQDVVVLTLTDVPDRGWRLWAYGGEGDPDRILFQEGSLYM